MYLHLSLPMYIYRTIWCDEGTMIDLESFRFFSNFLTLSLATSYFIYAYSQSLFIYLSLYIIFISIYIYLYIYGNLYYFRSIGDPKYPLTKWLGTTSQTILTYLPLWIVLEGVLINDYWPILLTQLKNSCWWKDINRAYFLSFCYFQKKGI